MSDAPRALLQTENALRAGTRLGEFEIRRQIGAGGFGIVYLAFDHALEREVAIKEYMPASMAGRTQSMHVSLRSVSDTEPFAIGLRSFINEAKLLARFDHPSLIKVHRFWEANDTAYMVMPVLRGSTFKEIRQSTGRGPDEAWVREMLGSLLGALEQLHNENVYHRDISPDNVHLDSEGRPVLLDLGAARQAIRDKTQPMTAILKPAYAPIEQYGETPEVKQGPWTDLYSLGATMHYMLLGRPPAPATARVVHNEASELAHQAVSGCSPQLLAVIDWMLAPRPQDRPQSVAELRAVLDGKAALPRRAAPPPTTASSWAAAAAELPMVTVPLGDAGSARSPARRAEPGAEALRSDASRPDAIRSDAMRADAAHRLPPPAAGTRLWPWLAIGLVIAGVAGYFGWQRIGATAVMVGDGRSGAAAAAQPPGGSPTTGAERMDGAPGRTAAAAANGAPAVASSGRAGAGDANGSEGGAMGGAADAAGDAASPRGAVPGGGPALAGPASPATRPAASASDGAPGAPVATATPGSATGTAGAAPSPAASASGSAAGPAGGGPRVQSTPTEARSAVEATRAPGPRPSRPVPADADEPPGASPEARCGGRIPLSQYLCMERECRRPRFTTHPECIAWRAQARPRDGAAGR